MEYNRKIDFFFLLHRMFRKNTPYKRQVIIAVAFLATIVVLVSSPGKKYEADILDKKINTSVPTPEEVLFVSESNSEEDTETPDKTSDKVEAETEEKQEGKTEGKATEQSDKEDNTGTEQAEAEETEQEIKETKTGEAETPELQEEVADPANKENENTTKNQESEAIGGPETEGIADISEPEAQTEEGKKEVVKGNINEEQAAEENTETEKTPEDAEDAETDTTKDDEKEEIGNINDQEVSKRALGGTAGQKAETLETEETNAIEKEEASEKMQKRTDRIQKKLENTDLSPEKRDVLLARLDRLENPQEKIRIKNLKNEIRNMRREAVLEKNLETEMDVKTIAPIRNKIIQARQQKAAPEKEALKNELKREGKARMERLKAINEELERETEEFIAQELPELTEAEKEEVKKVIEPDFVYELMDEPVEETPLFSDDPQLGEQWAVESIINDQLSIVNEWGTDGDSEPVIVAIIDTGVDLSHEDLAGQFWTNESCVDDLGELIEGGCLFGGYDFVDEDTNPMVEDGATHGTAVAGIIGAKTDNGIGMASVSKNGVRVMALKVAEDGLLTSESITRAIHFAILNGADIINMSFGGPTPSAVMKAAIAEAEQAGVIVTAAAGNYGLDNDVTPIYPASYDLGNIISVAALDRDDSLASFSDYGVNSVDIAAPGVSVLSTVPGGYQRLSGTSFSAPMVAAVLSVLPLSESNQTVSLIDFLIPKAHAEETTPTMTLGEFLNLLFNSVQSLTGLEGKVKGGKVLRFGEMGVEEDTTDEDMVPKDDVSLQKAIEELNTGGRSHVGPFEFFDREIYYNLDDKEAGEEIDAREYSKGLEEFENRGYEYRHKIEGDNAFESIWLTADLENPEFVHGGGLPPHFIATPSQKNLIKNSQFRDYILGRFYYEGDYKRYFGLLPPDYQLSGKADDPPYFVRTYDLATYSRENLESEKKKKSWSNRNRWVFGAICYSSYTTCYNYFNPWISGGWKFS
jgi:subtilisin family serine protease